ncbi:MAG: HlyD family efflux transporter periplasmic adaptor subunit [Oscillibacter sp.]|jgi:HlyD family secretion protein|nr:HlyD family efflux transporter periplasmic adaptor subunit [Oscillibacter sp.]
MSEVKEREELSQTQTAETPAVQAAENAPAKVPLKEKWKAMPRKKRRRIVRLGILLLVLALVGGGVYKLLGGKQEGENQIITDVVHYGSITSVVDGSGLTRAKSSETITLTTAGTVLDVLVAEGDVVTAGTPLFTIDSPAAETAVQKARSNLEGYQKQLNQAEKDIAGLNLSAGYPGKLLETVTLNPGDTISKGQKVAVLADDTRLRLTQYYSYAYSGELYAGQTVDVSVPALMSTIPGRIEAVHMVSRITSEGSKLFSAEIILDNEGALTAEMAASATVNVNGETVYPYEPGKLEYYRTGDLTSTVSGTVISSSLVDYLQVSTGQVLVTIDGEESESELFTIQQNLESAQEELETAEKNLANCNATAPIDGMVIGLTIQPGDEIAANTTVVTISDTSTITVSANVDERNISYIKPGMMVNLDQWGTPAMGTVETVSMSSTVNNGVATYPITISADNAEGSIQVNSYINYNLTASENDNCLILPLQCVRTVSTEEGETLQVVYVSGSKPDSAVENVMVDEMIPEGYWAVPVEIGISDNYNVEIRSGVEDGTEVFTQMQSMYGMDGGVMFG